MDAEISLSYGRAFVPASLNVMICCTKSNAAASGAVFQNNGTAPIVGVESLRPTQSSDFDYMVYFSEPVNNFDDTELTAFGATIISVTPVETTRVFRVTLRQNEFAGPATLNFSSAGDIVDTSGNPLVGPFGNGVPARGRGFEQAQYVGVAQNLYTGGTLWDGESISAQVLPSGGGGGESYIYAAKGPQGVCPFGGGAKFFSAQNGSVVVGCDANEVPRWNIAMRRPTRGPPSRHRWDIERPVDGQLSGLLDAGVHTNYPLPHREPPFWEVDLEYASEISQMLLINRHDSCGARLVTLDCGGPANSSFSLILLGAGDSYITHFERNTVENWYWFNTPVSNVRKIRLAYNHTALLHFAELMVFGTNADYGAWSPMGRSQLSGSANMLHLFSSPVLARREYEVCCSGTAVTTGAIIATNTAPRFMVSQPTSTNNTAGTRTFSVFFSEPVTGFNASAVASREAEVSQIVPISDRAYNVTMLAFSGMPEHPSISIAIPATNGVRDLDSNSPLLGPFELSADTTTNQPSFIAPANSATTSTATFRIRIPEPAAPGSIRLLFYPAGSSSPPIEVQLANTHCSGGDRLVMLNATDLPGSPGVRSASAPRLERGSYQVAVEYRDWLYNPVSSSANLSWTLQWPSWQSFDTTHLTQSACGPQEWEVGPAVGAPGSELPRTCVRAHWHALVSESGSRVLNSSVFLAGAGGGFPVTPCGEFRSWRANFALRLRMGDWEDFYRPTASVQSLCDMLSSGSLHLWSASLSGAFSTLMPAPAGFFGGRLPRNSSVSNAMVWTADARTTPSFWGHQSLAGGCCHSQRAPVEAPAWNRAFVMEIALGAMHFAAPILQPIPGGTAFNVTWDPVHNPFASTAGFELLLSYLPDMRGALRISTSNSTVSVTTPQLRLHARVYAVVRQTFAAPPGSNEAATWSSVESRQAVSACGAGEIAFQDGNGRPHCFSEQAVPLASYDESAATAIFPGNFSSGASGALQITPCGNFAALSEFVVRVQMGLCLLAGVRESARVCVSDLRPQVCTRTTLLHRISPIPSTSLRASLCARCSPRVTSTSGLRRLAAGFSPSLTPLPASAVPTPIRACRSRRVRAFLRGAATMPLYPAAAATPTHPPMAGACPSPCTFCLARCSSWRRPPWPTRATRGPLRGCRATPRPSRPRDSPCASPTMRTCSVRASFP